MQPNRHYSCYSMSFITSLTTAHSTFISSHHHIGCPHQCSASMKSWRVEKKCERLRAKTKEKKQYEIKTNQFLIQFNEYSSYTRTYTCAQYNKHIVVRISELYCQSTQKKLIQRGAIETPCTLPRSRYLVHINLMRKQEFMFLLLNFYLHIFNKILFDLGKLKAIRFAGTQHIIEAICTMYICCMYSLCLLLICRVEIKKVAWYARNT